MEENGNKSKKPSLHLQSTYYYFFKDSPTAMAIADRWGIILETNNSFTELIKSLSGSQIDISGSSSRLDSTLDFLPIHDAIRFSNLLSKLADDDAGMMDFKTPYRDKNDITHWFKIHAWKMNMDPRIDFSDRGNFIGFIINDETVEIETEQKLQEDMRVAERAMEAKSRFLAAMSHEIRTPIQTIIGMTELLEDTNLNKKQGEYAKQIQFSADVLLSLVNDILDYSKIEAGKMETERISFCPAESIEQAVKMLSQEMEKKGLKLIMKLEESASRNIIGDPGKFRQVLINLIKNAVKFTPEGTITVSATVAFGDERIRTITVSVADTGIGVPKEARERLFTTFMQADSSHTRRFGGTGLGLAISHNMVELMGGTIEMVPNREGGSIFRFTIPAEEVEPVSEIEDLLVPPDTQKSSAAAEFTSIAALRAMIVEDHPVNRQLFVLIMEKLGVHITQAEDGLDALEKADSGLDMIFMDIQMPRMNGYEAAAELRRRGFEKPLIAVTASVLKEDRKQCEEAGFDDILPKPFKKPEIEAMIQKWANQPLLASQFQPAGRAGKTEEAPDTAKDRTAQSDAKSRKDIQVFNREDLLDTFMQNTESAKTLLAHFLVRSAEQIESLPALAEEKNWEEAHRVAHSLKGSAKNLSGLELGNIAAIMENACKQIDIKIIESSMPALREAFCRYKEAAEEFIQS